MKDERDRVKACFDACRGGLLAVAFVSFFVSVLMLAVPLYMMQVFDRVLTSRSEDTLLYLTAAVAGALLVFGLLDAFRGRVLVRLSVWIEARLGVEAVRRALASRLHGSSYGTQSLRDLSQVRQFIASPSVYALFDAPWTPVYLLVVFLLHPMLGGIAAFGALCLFALAVANEVATRASLGRANEVWLGATRRVEAAATNADVIEAMGIGPAVSGRWAAENDEVLRLQASASDHSGFLLSMTKALRMALQAAVLGAGAYLVIGQKLTPGAMIAASLIMARALQPVEQAVGTWKALLSARAAYDRLRRFMSGPPFRAREIDLPKPRGELAVEAAAFVPPGSSTAVVANVSFRLDAGEVLAVIGPSGSGKSSLARLIVGTWRPSRGVVRLDGADVYTWDREDFGRHVGYLPQDVELFEGSVAENIARLGKAEDHAVVEAARRASIHEMVLRLPEGYHTRIGEGGLTLSGGQRQRVGLARALFGRPRLLVLDEPNANLDQDGEEALLAAIRGAKEDGATVIFIAHRPSLVASADKMLILRDGLVELFGPRAEVLPKVTRPTAVAATPAVLAEARSRAGI